MVCREAARFLVFLTQGVKAHPSHLKAETSGPERQMRQGMRFSMKARGSGWGLGALVIVVSGCRPAPPADQGPPHFVVADVIVSVTNQTPRALEIYLGTAALEEALGPVPGRASRSFSLPSGLGDSKGPLHFEARGRRVVAGIRSDTFSISPGERVLWTVGEGGKGTVTKR